MRLWTFFFNDTATTEIYTLSLHDALPIWTLGDGYALVHPAHRQHAHRAARPVHQLDLVRQEVLYAVADRKSTRLNSSHANISYAVFCLKKKNSPRRRALLVVFFCAHTDVT